MRLAVSLSRFFLVALTVLLFAAAPARAQGDPPAPDEWQAVITGQIEAFRNKDAAGALSFAGEAFQTAFKDDPQRFYLTIATTGYLPILSSVSHSFGAFELIGTDVVRQVVRLVDADQSLYEATYQLGREPGGWRVQGVALSQPVGVGV